MANHRVGWHEATLRPLLLGRLLLFRLLVGPMGQMLLPSSSLLVWVPTRLLMWPRLLPLVLLTSLGLSAHVGAALW